ncbi:glycoside hydrolase family protein [Simiduia agarivorans SA1 = DSM 21679]|uniref:Glycoside hydrolase family protein n=1 Tax=Simiduia agarivorans (strain DSM 21679 / JCM 13881 / BCRC 17597 / SA1) TaxID=1117647 RepID=K4L3M2_SIMAS|nr:glycoside hydrolase family protein [Simiduia agarivorans SA1 = DSM 21679]
MWSDEFDGSAIDSGKWSHEVNCAGGGNNELQCYTARPENSFVADGLLNIVARAENFQGPALQDDDPAYDADDRSASRNYTSARLRTKGQGDWRYGRMEIRAKMPQGQGLWPALWMLPTEWVYGGWPASGEIDIFEAVNSNAAGGNEIHGTLHYGRYWPLNAYTGKAITPGTPIWENFHTYAVEWEADEIRWYLNDTHFATQYPSTSNGAGWFNYYWVDQQTGFVFGENGAPFDQLFHLILNVAVGGNWPGAPDAQTSFPQSMQVDYVRVYECADSQGCATDRRNDVDVAGVMRPAQRDFPLYNDGLQSLTMTAGGASWQQPLALEVYDGGQPGRVQLSEPEIDGKQMLQVDFTGAGNAFFNLPDPQRTGVDAGVELYGMQTYGELRLRLKVISADAGTALKIKLDSGWPSVSEKTISLPADDQWVSVSVPFAQLQANPVEPGQVNYEQVNNIFVLEADGAISVQLDDIRIRCLADCGIRPIVQSTKEVITSSITLYDDAINGTFDLGLQLWESGSPHVQLSEVDVAGRGKVIDAQFVSPSANGIFFIQSTDGKDFSAFASTGRLQFDVRVLDYALASGLVARADCFHPCSSGDVSLGQPGLSDWQTVEVAVSDLATGGLALDNVNTPFVLMPTWGEQSGVHLQVDNIRWLLP